MIISSVLKYRINNGPAKFDSFTDGNLETQAAKVPGANLNDFIVLCHLSQFFEGYSDWYGIAPYRGSVQDGEYVTLGFLLDGQEQLDPRAINPSILPEGVLHPENTLSLVGFTTASLRACLSQYLIETSDPEVWQGLIEGKSISEIETLLRQQMFNGYVVGFSIIETATLKIMRCDEEDLDLLLMNTDTSYTDAFDLVKDSLIGRTEVLDQQGFSQARYIADGDYIEFVSDYGIIIEFDASAT